MTHAFSKGMEEIIRDATGMSVDEMQKSDHETIQRSIEKKIGHKLKFGYEPGLVPRNMLLAAGRIVRPEELEPPSVFATLIRLVWLYVASAFRGVFWILIKLLRRWL